MAEQETFTVLYEENESRKTLAATGAFGGPTPDGSTVVAHFYVEFPTVPDFESIPIQEGGVIDLAKGEKHKQGDLTRRVVSTLVVSPEVATRLGKWFTDRAKDAAKLMAEQEARKGAK